MNCLLKLWHPSATLYLHNAILITTCDQTKNSMEKTKKHSRKVLDKVVDNFQTGLLCEAISWTFCSLCHLHTCKPTKTWPSTKLPNWGRKASVNEVAERLMGIPQELQRSDVNSATINFIFHKPANFGRACYVHKVWRINNTSAWTHHLKY